MLPCATRYQLMVRRMAQNASMEKVAHQRNLSQIKSEQENPARCHILRHCARKCKPRGLCANGPSGLVKARSRPYTSIKVSLGQAVLQAKAIGRQAMAIPKSRTFEAIPYIVRGNPRCRRRVSPFIFPKL